MKTSSPMTGADLSAIERGIDAGDLTHAQVHQLIAEMRTALAHLDAIIAAYRQPGLGPLINTVREAQEWRGVVTSISNSQKE